jgi:hypothetical protein
VGITLVFEYQAFAIGSRSQAAKTFLERRYEGFNKYTPEQLIKDTLSGIKETLQGEKLTSANCTVAIVGRGEDGIMEPFQMIDANRIQAIITPCRLLRLRQSQAPRKRRTRVQKLSPWTSRPPIPQVEPCGTVLNLQRLTVSENYFDSCVTIASLLQLCNDL